MLCRNGVYYFVRRIPVDMQHHYDKCRLYFSLRTQSKVRAIRAAQSITQRLDDYRMGVRLQKLDIPKLSVIPDWKDRADNAPTLSEAVEFYFELKGHGKSKTFFRVGGEQEIHVDIRIIVATNRNLEEEVLKGRFREDLFYRINVFPIWVPPLRERKEDIHSIIYSKLPDICNEIGCEEKHISGEALKKLKKYDWPGNIRELENILERAVILCEGNTILSKHLKVELKDEEHKENMDEK